MQAPGYGYTDPMKPQSFGMGQQAGFGGSMIPNNAGIVPPFMQNQAGGPMGQAHTWGGSWGGQGSYGGGRPGWGQWGRQQAPTPNQMPFQMPTSPWGG